jgi:hypothetical protein
MNKHEKKIKPMLSLGSRQSTVPRLASWYLVHWQIGKLAAKQGTEINTIPRKNQQ